MLLGARAWGSRKEERERRKKKRKEKRKKYGKFSKLEKIGEKKKIIYGIGIKFIFVKNRPSYN
jgi:hypothetical protein